MESHKHHFRESGWDELARDLESPDPAPVTEGKLLFLVYLKALHKILSEKKCSY